MLYLCPVFSVRLFSKRDIFYKPTVYDFSPLQSANSVSVANKLPVYILLWDSNWGRKA